MMLQRLMEGVGVIVIAGSLAVLAARTPGQQAAVSQAPAVRVAPRPARYTSASSGKAMYVAYCAACHGKDGRGHGPAASALKAPPADLTGLAAIHGGEFPAHHVAQTILGDSNNPSHGSKDMPVWGSIFGAIGTKSDGMVRLRVRNLTKYIESLQRK